jgi:spoIIIJ-associated protein
VEEEVEFSGRTVRDAISNAERALGTNREQLTIEIISPGRGGVFGIGAEPARITARVKHPVAPQAVPSIDLPALAPEHAHEDGSLARPVVQLVPDLAGETADSDSTLEVMPNNGSMLAGEAKLVLTKLLESMGFDADITLRAGEDPITLAINGQNLGVLIGRRGDNLAALQFMVNLILSKNRRQWPRIVVDVENYRIRREESLRSLADRIAYRVRRNQKAFTLEAMPASDRRIIHLALRERDEVETYSIGEGPARRVVIAPTRTADNSQAAESRGYPAGQRST